MLIPDDRVFQCFRNELKKNNVQISLTGHFNHGVKIMVKVENEKTFSDFVQSEFFSDEKLLGCCTATTAGTHSFDLTV